MKLVVGLGNPGQKYQNNRHNIGFVVVERLNKVSGDGVWTTNKKFFSEVVLSSEFILAKPDTFMNESGRAVAAIARFYKIKSEDIYIVHDDLDIPLGSYKIVHGKGPQVHNGLLSVEKELGTDKFWNVRIGVENREVKGNRGIPGMVYSLQDFNLNEKKIIESVVQQIASELSVKLG